MCPCQVAQSHRSRFVALTLAYEGHQTVVDQVPSYRAVIAVIVVFAMRNRTLTQRPPALQKLN